METEGVGYGMPQCFATYEFLQGLEFFFMTVIIFFSCNLILIMDVFEHAFMLDYGLKRADYIEAFFKNIDWKAVEARL